MAEGKWKWYVGPHVYVVSMFLYFHPYNRCRFLSVMHLGIKHLPQDEFLIVSISECKTLCGVSLGEDLSMSAMKVTL